MSRAVGPSPLWPRIRWADILCAALLSIAWLPRAHAQNSAADYYVSSLPGAPSPLLKMYAGHIEITPEHHGNIFFWLFKNRHIANKQRTVIWFNGGPGCSSMDGALMEIGPYRVRQGGNLEYNNGSWDEFANILFVDQPVGTGFSYVDGDSMVHDLDSMASQIITFLEKWFALFPEYNADDIYLAGESYAGQYIPYIATAMLDRNARTSTARSWNVAGLMIGNGWISGPDQYRAYIPFMLESGIMKKGDKAYELATRQMDQCSKALSSNPDSVDINSCEAVMTGILQNTQKDNRCINMYDVRLDDTYPSCGMSWPPDLTTITPYLRRDDVTRALHINPDKKTGWTECSGQVGGAFRPRNNQPSVKLLPALLEKIPIILFSGDQDLICNHIGTENIISSLTWNGATGMETEPGVTAPRRDWTVEGEAAGTWQTARNLTYIRFYNSSHMVPFDYPRRTRDMLDRFMGVDIASIGGTPADSRIDGEKGLETSVGGHPNSTVAVEAEKERLDAATWAAYRKSGEVALVVVLIAAIAWGIFVWRDRRRRRGYKGVLGTDPYDGPGGLGLDRSKRSREDRDIEAAAAYDEAELDDLTDAEERKRQMRQQQEMFGLAVDDEDDEDERSRHTNSHAS